MGKDLKGRELGTGISQRKSDKRYAARYKGKIRYASSLKEIKRVYTQLVQDVEMKTYTDKSAITLEEYFEEWLEGRHDIKGSTKINYKSWFKWIAPELGRLRVQRIDKKDVKAFQAKLAKEGKAPKTVNAALTLLYSLMKQAREDGIIIVNPCEGVKGLKQKREDRVTNTIHRALTREEQAAFMAAAEDEWLYNAIAFMLCTGVRSGELRALRWIDIDHKNAAIHIRQNVTRDEQGRTAIDTPKTETSARDIPLTAGVKAILSRQRRQCEEMFGQGKVQHLNATVFLTVRGNILPSGSIAHAMRRVFRKLDAAGSHIEPISPHGLRDTFATRAIEEGMQPQTLKTILGHASLAMTMDLYAHVLPNTKAAEMEKISTAF